jgi:hypothetical protein
MREALLAIVTFVEQNVHAFGDLARALRRESALQAVSRITRAQIYPSRPVRIIVPYPAGGFGDISARLMGQWISERLGQQFVIENRPGASENIGTEAAVRAPPDGYTLLLINTGNASNAALYPKLNFVRSGHFTGCRHRSRATCDGGQSIISC